LHYYQVSAVVNATVNYKAMVLSLQPTWYSTKTVQALGFCSSATQDSSLMGCNVTSLGKWFPTLWRNMSHSCSTSTNQWKMRATHSCKMSGTT